MIRIIVGENASGKTLYLDRILEKYGLSECCTNIVDDPTLNKVEYNDKRIWHLSYVLETSDIELTDQILRIADANAVLTPNFDRLATIICKNRDILILDEPCFGLKFAERCRLLSFLNLVNVTFKEVYIVTHNEVMLSIDNIDVSTIEMDRNTSGLKLIPVSEDKWYEVID